MYRSRSLNSTIIGLFSDSFVLLQSMIDKLIEVGRGYGMEINAEN
jgi:hypothetical protein